MTLFEKINSMKITILLISVLFLVSCGEDERDVQNAIQMAAASKEGKFFMWDGIAVNLGAIDINCKEDVTWRGSNFGWYPDTVLTFNCQSFGTFLARCLAARELDGEDEIKKHCLKHHFDKKRY